jgi:4-diphosphocytidyl-2-C-methyl-D-erythritol kinase
MGLVKIRCLSPAKINLMLRVLARRSDGYHDLQTCFQLLDWGDDMIFEQLNEQGEQHISIDGFADLAIADNLIHKAAMLLKPHATHQADWHIRVKKEIPEGAGLGGGSSNAATTLLVLNEHWRCGLTQQELLRMGRQLGADVPVFLFQQSAVAGGTGHRLTAKTFNTPWILLMLPGVHINTASLFADPLLNRQQQPLSQSQLDCRDLWINDFFPVVLARSPEVHSLYQRLRPLGQRVRMSGTGSALFALFADQQSAEAAREQTASWVTSLVVEPKI